MKIKLDGADRRREPRHPVFIPVVYSSENLTFDGIVRDLSHGGMYVASDLLDPIGTRCQLQVLPEGRGAVQLEGVVCHVVQHAAGQGGNPPGLGIQFADVAGDARGWVEAAVAEAVGASGSS